MPTRIGEAKRQRKARQWWIRAGVFVGLLIVAFAATLVLRLILVQQEITQLKQWQANHASALQMVQDTQAAWHELRPVVATEAYPLETLLRVSDLLPTDQVRITLFEAEGDHLLIKAEAKNLTTAFQFFDALKKSTHLTGYNWEMAQPRSLPNDVTQLQIEGTHATGD